MTKKTYLITGGAGFIGSNVVVALAQRGARVVVCDWLRTGAKWKNIDDAAITDVLLPPELPAFLEREGDALGAVVHMGAISATDETNVDALVSNNIRLSLDLWEFCTRKDVPFIYASSAATYGNGDAGFTDNWDSAELLKLRPLNAYGWSKAVVDRRIVMDVEAGYPTPPQWAGLKFFNVYGPREEHKGGMRSVISQIIPRILAGEPVGLFRSYNPAYEDGFQLRDFVHVDDCVAVILWLLDNPSVSGIFNAGTGKARSFYDLAMACFTAFNQDPRIEFVDMPEAIRSKYQYFTEADVSRLRAAGYTDEFKSLENGVSSYVQSWMRRYGHD